MKTRGRLIVFEGVDAAGKTTLCNDLSEFLRQMQQLVINYHFPGKTPGTLGELVYRIHHYHKDTFCIPRLNPCALQLLHIAAHIDIIESAIKRSLNEGAWVVLDRFWWSTYVYGSEDGVSDQSLELMINLEKTAWGNILPEVLLLIDSASPLRDDERNCIAWHRKRELYYELVKKEKDSYRCVVIETGIGQRARKGALKKIIREVLY